MAYLPLLDSYFSEKSATADFRLFHLHVFDKVLHGALNHILLLDKLAIHRGGLFGDTTR